MSAYLDDGDVVLYRGDVLDVLAELALDSVDCVVTSPPYFGLRDYGVDGQIGLEPTLAEYVARLVDVFREVRRVLAPHGVCWLNLGDSYAGSWGNQGRKDERGTQRPINGGMLTPVHDGRYPSEGSNTGVIRDPGLKPKDLMGVPWRVALALQEDGWWLRSDVVWSKPNPMPESVTDRPTRSHEYLFLLTKASRYYWDAEAVRERADGDHPRSPTPRRNGVPGQVDHGLRPSDPPTSRNIRSVWEIATHPFPEAHFATFPSALVERCLKAACPERVCRTCGEPSRRMVQLPDGREAPRRATAKMHRPNGDRTSAGQAWQEWRNANPTKHLGWTDCGHDDWRPGLVLDPFMGSGTTAHVARRLGLHAVGIDLSAEYLAIAARRLQQLSLLA